MKKIKRCLMAAALVAAIAAPVVHATGIPTVDLAALTQRVQQLMQLQNQLETMKMQLQSQANQLKAVTGSRGMGSLLQNNLDQLMPKSGNIYDGGQVSMPRADDLMKQIIAGSGKAPDQIANDNASNAALAAAWSEGTYTVTTKRVETLQSLADNINATPDAKASADLQARIAVEQAAIANEANRLAVLRDRAQAQKDMQEAEQDARAAKEFDPANQGVPSLLD